MSAVIASAAFRGRHVLGEDAAHLIAAPAACGRTTVRRRAERAQVQVVDATPGQMRRQRLFRETRSARVGDRTHVDEQLHGRISQRAVHAGYGGSPIADRHELLSMWHATLTRSDNWIRACTSQGRWSAAGVGPGACKIGKLHRASRVCRTDGSATADIVVGWEFQTPCIGGSAQDAAGG